jgi:hypothetical protein
MTEIYSFVSVYTSCTNGYRTIKNMKCFEMLNVFSENKPKFKWFVVTTCSWRHSEYENYMHKKHISYEVRARFELEGIL